MNAVNTAFTPNTDAHITVSDLTMAYGDFIIQQDLNFMINHGDIFIIMGGSGCGKTTLLKHLVGLIMPSKGDVFFGSSNFWKSSIDEQETLKHKFGVMFQAGALWSSLTLADNIALPLGEFTDLAPAEIHDIVSFKLALVGLAGYEEFYPSELSGGMRKRASLARAMALDPEILFFDEPSSGLDPLTARRLDELIIELCDSLGTTIVVVTHDLASIFTIGSNSIFLDEESRTMIASGDPKRLRDESSVAKVRAFLTRGQT